jgi:hypothetical protein
MRLALVFALLPSVAQARNETPPETAFPPPRPLVKPAVHEPSPYTLRLDVDLSLL